MNGCRCCFNCPRHRLNKRKAIVPCNERKDCKAWLDKLQEDKIMRQAEKERRSLEIAYAEYRKDMFSKGRNRK